MPVDLTAARSATEALERYLGTAGFVGFDPYDALASRPLASVAARSRRLGQAATAAVRLSPVNLRPLLHIPKTRNAKATALLTLAACARYRQTRGAAHDARARQFAAELAAQAIRSIAGTGWGYNFPWANRSFFAPAGTPNAVVTCFVLDALAEVEGPASPFVRDGIAFLERGLNWSEGPWVSYTPLDRREVVNVQALVASALVRHGGASSQETGSRMALRICGLQRPDGSWPYGTAANDGFVDLVHSGYVLRSLADIQDSRPVPGIQASLERGLAFFGPTFIGPAGHARPVTSNDVAAETHAWAEAVLVACRFREPWLPETLSWGLEHLRNADGSFVYQLRRGYAIRTPFLRWSQAWAYLALATVLNEVPA